MCMIHSKCFYSWDSIKVIILLQSKLGSVLAPGEGVVESGRLMCRGSDQSHHQLSWWGSFASDLMAPCLLRMAAPPLSSSS